MEKHKVITRSIGEGGKIIIPQEIINMYKLGKGDYIDWHVGEKIEVTFGENIKKEKGKVT